MRRVLAIRTADSEFGEKLAKNFNRDIDSVFQTFVFSEQEAFINFAKANKISVLLCDEEFLNEQHINENIKEADVELILSLSEMSVAGESGGTHSIFKYQASEDIMREIMFYYDQFKGTAVPEMKTDMKAKKVCSVCSPVGGAYSSTFALALAYHYSQSGKTLFISFDPFFILPGREKNPIDKDLTDIIFYICTNFRRSDLNERVAGFVRECSVKMDNLEMVIGVSHWFDICDMSVKSIHTLLESTCSTGAYQNVVFDIGIFGASSLELFLVSDTIYVPANDSFSSGRKIEEWKRQIRYSGKEMILEKTKEIRIPIDQGLKGAYQFSDLLNGTLGKFINYYNF